MASEEKATKKVSKPADEGKDEKCVLLERIVERTKKRINNLSEAIDNELNPLHRLELEAKRTENSELLCFLSSLTSKSRTAQFLNTLFGE